MKRLLLLSPLTYCAIAAVLALPAGWTFRFTALACLLLFFSPLFDPAGEAAYRLIARNRHRLPSGKVCRRD